jgi:hypothetical protein
VNRGAGNRFMIYALFLECRVSMHVIWGFKQQNTVFAIGKSIIDRSSPIDIGTICLEYGGGHKAAGTCQVDNARVVAELIEKLASPRAMRQARPASSLRRPRRTSTGREEVDCSPARGEGRVRRV